jgi:hypothetical protein
LRGALDLSQPRVDVVALPVASRYRTIPPLLGLDFDARVDKLLATLMLDTEAHGGEAVLIGAAAAVEGDSRHGGAGIGSE